MTDVQNNEKLNVLQLIRLIVEVDAITTKWLMWSEMNLPEQERL